MRCPAVAQGPAAKRIAGLMKPHQRQLEPRREGPGEHLTDECSSRQLFHAASLPETQR
jgi:hypothetical protein